MAEIMSEIPDDIQAAAMAVVDRGYDVGLLHAVAAALMKERERCAKIVECGCDNPFCELDEAAARIARIGTENRDGRRAEDRNQRNHS